MIDRLARAGSAAIILTAGLLFAAAPHERGKKDDWLAPEEARKRQNPVAASPAALAVAKAVYVEKCAQCHGDGGKGDGPEAPMYSVKPADFTDARMMDGMTDGEIFWKISEGRKPMPIFKKQLTEVERWQLVHYIRLFAPKPGAHPRSGKAPDGKKTAREKSAGPASH